jgi:hypothetical protein
MTNKKQIREKLSWEDAVARHLRDNPDYFVRHLDLLEILRVPHPAHGGAVSLIERQIDALRDKYALSERQLRDLVDMARDNDRIAARLHRFALALIDCGSVDDVFETVHGLLRQEFDLDIISLLIEWPEQGDREVRPEFMVPREPRFEALWARCADRKPVCAPALDAQSLQFLFQKKGDVKSTALIPLQGTAWRGLLALGSHDHHRFHAAMGTLYLTRLGELLTHSLSIRFNVPGP